MNKHVMNIPEGYVMGVYTNTTYRDNGTKGTEQRVIVTRATEHALAQRDFDDVEKACDFMLSPQGQRFGGPLEIVEMEPPASNLRTSPAMRERILAAI